MSSVVPFPQDERAAPPEHLSPAEAETWRAVIASREPGYFTAAVFPLIMGYATTAMMCDHIAARLRAQGDVVDAPLLECFDRMTRSLSWRGHSGCFPETSGQTAEGRRAASALRIARAPRSDKSDENSHYVNLRKRREGERFYAYITRAGRFVGSSKKT
jgi:hypothetical protein